MLSTAYTAEKLNLPGYDSFENTELIHQKDKYRTFAETNGILSPNAKGYDDFEKAAQAIDKFNYPVIVKPVDLTGGKGIGKVEYKENFVRYKCVFAMVFVLKQCCV